MKDNQTLAAHTIDVSLGGQAILKHVSTAVVPGVVTALVGPNGAGKSTLLHVLCGDHSPGSGSVTLNGQPLGAIGVSEQARLRSVMSQSNAIAFDFLVDDILGMGWVRSSHAGASDFRSAFRQVVADCGIQHLAGRRFNTLSGGEQQRVHFARALLQVWPGGEAETRYLLLDEPTSSLDLAHELLVLRLVRRAAVHGLGVLVVLHDLDLTARFADRVILMAQGQVLACGNTAEILEPARLSEVYGTPVQVEWHPRLDRLVVYS